MSVRSWKKEFYPISAIKLAEKTDDPIQLTEHALRKWKGLIPLNLNKHELKGPPFFRNEESCSLCQHFLNKYNQYNMCERCPIVRSGQLSCCDESDSSSYNKYLETGNVIPMIKTLEKALIYLLKKKKLNS